MKTNSIEELKKIELHIYDNNYDKEVNSFLSVRIDTRDYIKYFELTDKEKREILEIFYSDLLKNSSKVDYEYIHNLLNEDYKFNEYDEKLLQLMFTNITDNLLYLENNLPSNKLKYICLKTSRNNIIANNIIGFLSLDLNNFNGFFKFFLTFLCEFINRIPTEYQDLILKNQIGKNEKSEVISFFDEDIETIDIDMLKKCAKTISIVSISSSKNDITSDFSFLPI